MINKIKNNKLLLVILILIIVLVILLVSRFTFAYLEAIDSAPGITTGEIESSVERFFFTNDEDLSLIASTDNFSTSDTNLTATVHPKATLIASVKTKTATKKYSTGIKIKTNTFTNSQDGNPELILTITGPDGEIVRNVPYNSLDFKTIENTKDGTIQGFDITNKTGTFSIAIDKEIASTNYTTGEIHEWTYAVTFINYEYDQSINETAKFDADVIIQEEKIVSPTIETLNTLLTNANKDGKYTLYHHNAEDITDSDMPNQDKIAGDDSYRYSGGNDVVNNYVCFGGNCSNNVEDSGYKNLYRIIGLFKNDSGQYEMKIIKADAATKEDLGEGNYPDSAYQGEYKSSYISSQSYYKGQNWDNIASYYWNDTAGPTEETNNVNMWAESNLNTKNLNETYYDAIDATYRSMVVEHEWQVGAVYSPGDAKEIYDYELGGNKLTGENNNCYNQGSTTEKRQCNLENDLTYSAYVGLMYISDYMYGTLPEYWNTTTLNYDGENVKSNNWLHLGINEWTISRDSDYGDTVRSVYDSTDHAEISANVYDGLGVRPVLYLSSDVIITDGSGTDTDPYKLAIL